MATSETRRDRKRGDDCVTQPKENLYQDRVLILYPLKLQNGKAGETVNLSSANAAAAAENATSVPSS